MIIANIFALISSLFMVASGILTSKKGILAMQTGEIFFCIISNVLAGGYSGAIINLVSLARNIMIYRNNYGVISKIIIVVLSIVLVLMYNELGTIGLLPLMAMFIYALLMDTDNIKNLKIFMIIIMMLWATYDMAIKLYVAVFFDILTLLSSLVSLLLLEKNQKEKTVKASK